MKELWFLRDCLLTCKHWINFWAEASFIYETLVLPLEPDVFELVFSDDHDSTWSQPHPPIVASGIGNLEGSFSFWWLD